MRETAARGTRKRSLPRWLYPAMRRLSLAAAVGVIGTFSYIGWIDGTFRTLWSETRKDAVDLTGKAGFRLVDVLVEGRRETDKDELIKALGIKRGDPVFDIDLDVLRQRVEQLPWVSRSTVQRRLPDIVYVRLWEREPLAIWQNDRRFTVIDRAGRPLADAIDLAQRGNKRIETLPQIVGPEAPAHVGSLLEALDKVPEIRKRMMAASWIGNRRWNLRLNNGVIIKLPENGMLPALLRLEQFQTRERVFERDIVAVDLRQNDRLILQTAGNDELEAGPGPRTKPGTKT